MSSTQFTIAFIVHQLKVLYISTYVTAYIRFTSCLAKTVTFEVGTGGRDTAYYAITVS